eukprot:7996978-Alexandrium_andersonii.AAC.1
MYLRCPVGRHTTQGHPAPGPCVHARWAQRRKRNGRCPRNRAEKTRGTKQRGAERVGQATKQTRLSLIHI